MAREIDGTPHQVKVAHTLAPFARARQFKGVYVLLGTAKAVNLFTLSFKLNH